MTELQVVEAIKQYAARNSCTIDGPENNMIEVEFSFETDRRLMIGYELTSGQSAYITFKYIVGQLSTGEACLDLFFLGNWPTTSFYFRGKEIKGTQYLFAETRIYLHQDLSVEQATDILTQQARLPIFEPKWPEGVDIF